MIKRLTIRNFKRFTEQVFDLHDSVVLAGPNNSGKSTLLQAIATWRMGLDHWVTQYGKGKRRPGVPLSRPDFTAVPLREMNLLWRNRRPAGSYGIRYRIEIIVEGESSNGSWECGMEFEYVNSELIYVRPLNALNVSQDILKEFPPEPAKHMGIVFIPVLSGLAKDETRLERGMQNLLIGEGRAGDILRNLLLQVSEEQEAWKKLTAHMQNLFGIRLLKPKYSPAQAYILCEYLEPGNDRPLDLTNTGSGTLQVLLVLAFLYARPASVILIDEPDAHQHIILQQQVYKLIRNVAHQLRGQVIIATHSEVVLDATAPERIVAFLGNDPRPLTNETERDRLREALKRVTNTDLLVAKEIGKILYTEGDTDALILAEWARVLNHPSRRFLSRSFVRPLGGNNLRVAKDHLFAMKAVEPTIQGLCLLDGDNRDKLDTEFIKEGPKVVRWKRYEIENYLLIPEAIKRFVRFPLAEPIIDQEFDKQVPPETDLFSDHIFLVRVKASTEFLEPLLTKVGEPTPKKDLYLLASVMKADEIHPEVIDVLNRIYELAQG